LYADDARTTQARRQIVQSKRFLRQLYAEWYSLLVGSVPAGPGAVLELGSGPGFFREFLPEVITSEIVACGGVRAVLDARALPFADASLRAIVMTDVLHHVPSLRPFFAEAARCVRPGGVVAMIEPWVTTWSRLVYGYVHPEPFQPEATSWEFPPAGPLAGANVALPWIVFERDRAVFEREFPQWRVADAALLMPFRYLLSGGVSPLTLMPGWSFPAWRELEGALAPCFGRLAMFAHIVLNRVGQMPTRT
jgi:SAM-dependent methyltransferase